MFSITMNAHAWLFEDGYSVANLLATSGPFGLFFSLVNTMRILTGILNRIERIRWGRAAAAYYRSCEQKSEELARRYAEHTVSGGDLKPFGQGSAAYYVDQSLLSDSPLAYSFGVGCDITFDLDLIDRTNATVYAFDPTDEAASFLGTQTIPKSFHFMQVGVADEDGEAEIQDIKPGSQTYRPATLLDIGKANGITKISTRTFKSLADELGHQQIDVMKLDIEGGEYKVVATLSDDFKPAKQIAMEYHPYLVNLRDGKPMDHDHGWKVTTDSIESLIKLGYRLTHISERGTEISFRLQD